MELNKSKSGIRNFSKSVSKARIAKRKAANLYAAVLIASHRKGDEKAFPLLYTIYFNEVVAFNMSFFSCEADAKDAAQIYLIELMDILKTGKYKEKNCFGSWLCSYVKRRNKREKQNKFCFVEMEEELLETIPEDEPAAEEISRDVIIILNKAINSLPKEDKKLYTLREKFDYSWIKVGKKLKIQENTASQRYYRILEYLQTFLKKHGINKEIFN